MLVQTEARRGKKKLFSRPPSYLRVYMSELPNCLKFRSANAKDLRGYCRLSEVGSVTTVYPHQTRTPRGNGEESTLSVAFF